jgi:hypothetical protein
MPSLAELDLRRRLCDMRRALIEQLASAAIEPGLLALLANVQTAIAAIDADTCPKEQWRE